MRAAFLRKPEPTLLTAVASKENVYPLFSRSSLLCAKGPNDTYEGTTPGW